MPQRIATAGRPERSRACVLHRPSSKSASKHEVSRASSYSLSEPSPSLTAKESSSVGEPGWRTSDCIMGAETVSYTHLRAHETEADL
eukprot:1475851-Amphidinium_carterae.1